MRSVVLHNDCLSEQGMCYAFASREQERARERMFVLFLSQSHDSTLRSAARGALRRTAVLPCAQDPRRMPEGPWVTELRLCNRLSVA